MPACDRISAWALRPASGAAPGLDYIPRNFASPREVTHVGRDCKHAKGPAEDAKHNLKAVRDAYYDKISKHDMAPLWEVLKNVVT